MQPHTLEIHHANNETLAYRDKKDPSLPTKYVDPLTGETQIDLYASVGTVLTEAGWGIGHFRARSLDGPFEELPLVKLHGVNGLEACAPAVTRDKDGTLHMYVQENCFQQDGDIAEAVSQDGENFTAVEPAMTVERVREAGFAVKALYDAGASRTTDDNGDEIETLVFSGYRENADGTCRVGCGDMYYATRNVDKAEKFGTPSLLLDQDDVHFHSGPADGFVEWGNEGGQFTVLKMTYDNKGLPDGVREGPLDPTAVETLEKHDEERNIEFGLAVCFKPLRHADAFGTRQNVFAFARYQGDEKFTPLGMMLHTEGGENGHPDFVVEDDKMHVFFQERFQIRDDAGKVARNQHGHIEMSPWDLCHETFNANAVYMGAREILDLPDDERGLRSHLPLAFLGENAYASDMAAARQQPRPA